MRDGKYDHSVGDLGVLNLIWNPFTLAHRKPGIEKGCLRGFSRSRVTAESTVTAKRSVTRNDCSAYQAMASVRSSQAAARQTGSCVIG
jgi:hypothetical protein